jgi:Cation efflux system protein CusB domain 1
METVKKHTYQSRSEEVQEILSRPPAWIIRWGTGIAFGFLVILTCIAWLIPAPTLIGAQVKLVQQNPPRPEANNLYEQEYIAVATLSQDKFAKIKPGQQVLVKLDAYDFREFGMLHGTVNAISDFNEGRGTFDVYILLPKNHKTTTQYLTEYKSGMTGHADIVIAEKKLIEKFSPF